jgi:hypothetical protein
MALGCRVVEEFLDSCNDPSIGQYVRFVDELKIRKVGDLSILKPRSSAIEDFEGGIRAQE